MSRFRVYPTPVQVGALSVHCEHARFVWKLAVGLVGIDHGVSVTPAWTDGTEHQASVPVDIRCVTRRLSRCRRVGLRGRAKGRLAWLHARNTDRRRDFVEKAGTRIARGYDLIWVEGRWVANMTRSARCALVEPGRNVAPKAGLSRSILASRWAVFVTRLGQKAPGRVEKVDPAFSSQRCSVCEDVAVEGRQGQALFACVACGHPGNGDLNAARSIAAGRVLTARGATALPVVVNRKPQRVASSVA